MNIYEWRKTIRNNFPDLLTTAELALSVAAQLSIKDVTNCFALAITGPPSSGKTIVIDFFRCIDDLTYTSDSFTPASFLSHAANVKEEKLSKIDLLPRIKHKVLLVPDLAPIFSLREDDLVRNLGVLTRVLDGQGLATDSGIRGRRALEGDYVFMMIAATTPVSRRVWKAMSVLGPRMFFYHLQPKDKGVEELVKQNRSTSWSDKVICCRKVTQVILQKLRSTYPQRIEWKKESDPTEHLDAIARMARLLARLRAKIDHDSEEKSEYSEREQPDRINQCLYNLARGHALIADRTQITTEDLYWPLLIALNSAPEKRVQLLKELLIHKGHLRTTEARDLLQCSTPVIHKHMDRMVTIGLCRASSDKTTKEKSISLKEEFHWFFSEECIEILSSITSENTNDSLVKSDVVFPMDSQ